MSIKARALHITGLFMLWALKRPRATVCPGQSLRSIPTVPSAHILSALVALPAEVMLRKALIRVPRKRHYNRNVMQSSCPYLYAYILFSILITKIINYFSLSL
jgi:hypothetical protein